MRQFVVSRTFTSDMLSVADVSGDMCHALNNVAAALFASLSHLESAPPSEAVVKAARSVEGACASTRALAAAAYLLSLDCHEHANVAGVTTGAFALDRESLRPVADALSEVAGVRCEATWPQPGVAIAIDADTLMAILLCQAFDMRRHARPGSPIVMSVGVDPPRPAESAVVRFTFASENTASSLAGGHRPSRPHLCAVALAHAASVFPAGGLFLETSPGPDRQVGIPCIAVRDASAGRDRS